MKINDGSQIISVDVNELAVISYFSTLSLCLKIELLRAPVVKISKQKIS